MFLSTGTAGFVCIWRLVITLRPMLYPPLHTCFNAKHGNTHVCSASVFEWFRYRTAQKPFEPISILEVPLYPSLIDTIWRSVYAPSHCTGNPLNHSGILNGQLDSPSLSTGRTSRKLHHSVVGESLGRMR